MTTSNSATPASLFRLGEVVEQFTRKPPLILGVILQVLPVLYLIAYGKGSAAGVVTIATLALEVITLAGGLKIGAINAPIFAVLVSACCVAAGRPLAAGAVAMAVALWASFGAASGKATFVTMPCSMMTVLVMIPPKVVHGSSVHAWRNVGAVFFYAIVAAAWGIAIGLLLRRGRKIPAIPGATWQWGLTQGLMVGTVMAVVATVATSRHLGQGGAWLLMTVFLVFKPLTPAPWQRSLNRSLGTLFGVLIAAIYLWSLPSSAPTLTLLLPSALLLVAAAQVVIANRWPYWCFVTLLTPGIVLMLASMTSTSHPVMVARNLDALRLEYSVLGILIALAAQGVLIGLASLFRNEESSWFGVAARADPGGS